MTKYDVESIKAICSGLQLKVFDTEFEILVERDKKQPETGRAYIQLQYTALDSKTGTIQRWRGRKWYLSSHMTDDEVVKTVYAAFEMAVKHEVMEGFTYFGKRIFNPHASLQALYDVCETEVHRV